MTDRQNECLPHHHYKFSKHRWICEINTEDSGNFLSGLSSYSGDSAKSRDIFTDLGRVFFFFCSETHCHLLLVTDDLHIAWPLCGSLFSTWRAVLLLTLKNLICSWVPVYPKKKNLENNHILPSNFNWRKGNVTAPRRQKQRLMYFFPNSYFYLSRTGKCSRSNFWSYGSAGAEGDVDKLWNDSTVSQHLWAITQTSFRPAATFVYILTNSAVALLTTKKKIPREEVTFVPCYSGRFMIVYL